MPIVNRAADLQPEIQAWRRDIHEHPELGYEEQPHLGFRGRAASGVRLR